MKKVYSLILVISSFNLNAQSSDFIVTKNLDTIYGQIIRVYWNALKFKKNDKKTKYQAVNNELKECYWAKKSLAYELVKPPIEWNLTGERVFLERKINGKIKLFVDYSDSGNSWFISKDDSKLKILYGGWGLKLKGEKLKMFKDYISDNEKALKEFDALISGKQNYDSISRFIDNYNSSY